MPYPLPVLETSRLTLRSLTTADAPDVFLMRSDPEVMQYIPRPLAASEEEMVQWIQMINDFAAKDERFNWAIEWKETGKAIGTIGYVNLKPEHQRAEIGYSLTRAWHRKGIMREALLRMIRYGFEDMQLHSIEAIIDAENVASGSLLESVGFTREAFFREDFLHNGMFRNSIHYGLLRSDPILP